MTWATVSVAGREVRLNGFAPDESAAESARSALSMVPGVRAVVDDLAIRVAAYEMAGSFDGTTVTLRGFLPDERARRQRV